MSYEILEAKLKSIPEEFFDDVANFFDLLEYKIKVQQEANQKIRKLGGYEGQIKISDDFDEIPEGFEEYIQCI